MLFLQMTMLSLPSLMALIAPNAMLMASLYTLDRMNGDSELIVMTASGAPVWRIGASLFLMSGSGLLGILLANCSSSRRACGRCAPSITQVRADLISQVLQPGRFSSPEAGLTFHIRDRSPNGDLLGLLVHDERDAKQVMSYLAERGRIISNDEGSYLVMFDGYVHRFNEEDVSKGVQIVAFDQNMLDLSELAPKDDDEQRTSASRALYWRTHQPRPQGQDAIAAPGQMRSELHERLVDAASIHSLLPSSPSRFWATPAPRERAAGAQILLAFGIAVGLRVAGHNGRQSGDPERVGHTSRVCYSDGGDYRCGLDGAR